MKKMILLCGPSLSGKSTLRTRLVNELRIPYVSFDEINEERGVEFGGGEENPQSEWAKTLDIAKAKIEEHLNEGNSVVVDDTLCFRWIRDEIKEIGQKHGYQSVLLYLHPGCQTLRNRWSAQQARPVLSEEVFEKHLREFEPPADDEQVVRLKTFPEVQTWMDEFRKTP